MDTLGAHTRRPGRRGTWVALWLAAVACVVAALGLLALVAAGNEWERSVGGRATTDDDDLRFTIVAVGLVAVAVGLGLAARRIRRRSLT